MEAKFKLVCLFLARTKKQISKDTGMNGLMKCFWWLCTDLTSKIAQKFGARIVQFNYEGGWPKKKNWALENLPFSHEWVLILDADECLPSEAEEEIKAIVNNSDEKHSGYWINRRYYFLGKPLKHAYFPIGIFVAKHQKGRYEKITDLNTDSGDNEVHEHVLVNGSTKQVNHGSLRVSYDR